MTDVTQAETWGAEDWNEAQQLVRNVLNLSTTHTTEDTTTIDLSKAVFLLNVCLLALVEEAKSSGGLPDQKLPMVSTIAGDKLLVSCRVESLDSRFADLADTYRAQEMLEKIHPPKKKKYRGKHRKENYG